MMGSLRIRLLMLLGVAIMLATVVQFGATFRASMDRADALFDFHMRQMALALQDSNFDRPEWTVPDTEQNPFFEFIIQVWTSDGRQIYQTPGFRSLPPQGPMGYAVIGTSPNDWRTYKVASKGRAIQIAQRIESRHRRAVTIAFESVWPLLPVAMLLFGTVWWVVTSALAPVVRVGAELAERNASSLAPVSDKGIPGEVRPLVKELNSLLARLSMAIESQQHFVSDAAHELRSPLTALKLQVQTLSRARTEDMKEQATRRLEEGVERATRLIEQLLALARQEPRAMREAPAEASLSQAVRLAIADTVTLVSMKNISVECQRLDEAPLRANIDDLHILARNLLDNAIRYTPQGGMVRIDLQATPELILLRIDDTGPGIPDDSMHRVFDRFFRVPGNDASGSGLGLAIVKAIADRYGAAIRLERSQLGGLGVSVAFSRKQSEGIGTGPGPAIHPDDPPPYQHRFLEN
jgi:two-component system, OmpR family, sensor kinase